MAKHTIGRVIEFPMGIAKEVKIQGKRFLIANVGGSFHMVDADCSHCAGKLIEKRLEGNVLKCPIHGAEFDVRTGKNIKKPKMLFAKGADLQTYKVQVDGDNVVVEL